MEQLSRALAIRRETRKRFAELYSRIIHSLTNI